ncbi:male-specific lethal 3 homolog [Contarinia nasturtii]|uniref:male-specific lethal 3 homolog n=1 Tax=Contarinia nasturtii TaxID=265458 RepID=UPI0012D4B879|nr:male-specific lethal 3 homolog [Contarinia nasturtii]XP_031618869.1 male-specific lethal 3 homolog [Contarinia nasturtii]
MVSTRGTKYKFAVGERVLCYEPDPSKAKVLYDSKVVEIIEEKDKKGRRSIEYLIHFQGWNSSWDRRCQEDFVLKDTDKNRQLQRDLAEKSQLQIGAYLYRKERKIRKGSSSNIDPKTPFRPSSDDGSSCCSSTPGNVVQEEIPENMSNKDDAEQPEAEESCSSSSAESTPEEQNRVALQISEYLKRFLEYDFTMINQHKKLLNLPAKISVIAILENFVKYHSIKAICAPNGNEGGPRRRNSAAKTEKREKDYDKLKASINLRKETADGLRIYFNFLIKDYLLYKPEREQAAMLLSDEYLNNFTYVGSEKISLDAVFAFKQGTQNIPENSEAHQSSNTSESTSEGPTNKRRLRSHKTEEDEIILDLGAVSLHTAEVNSTNSSDSGATSQANQLSSLNLLRQLLPMNMAVPVRTRELLQDILSWQLLPSDSSAEPSHIYGAVHLSRLFVKLPEFLNASSMPDDKIKLLLTYIASFMEFFETQKEWFTEDQYKSAIKVEELSSSAPSPLTNVTD